MKVWIDAQLPLTLADWLTATFGLEAIALRDLSLRDAQDREIFEAARSENAVIMTKDSDLIDLVCRLGAPPQIIWLTCGNVTNRNLKQLLTATLPTALEQLRQGEMIVEISKDLVNLSR
jgi:predicted nuclease of predicted toxin-antitoxin system